jgi:predicted permease
MTTPMPIADFARDAHFAVRQLNRHRWFAAVAALTLALGIGATTTLFTVLNAVVLTPLSFPHSERLVEIHTTWRGDPGAVSVGDYFVITKTARTLESVAARAGATFNLADDGEPERVVGARVTASYFTALGTPAKVGRVFTAAEDAPGQPKVALISDRLFKRRFGADPTLVGRSIQLSDVPHVVIGVMPGEFQIPEEETDIWTPIAFTAERSFDAHYLDITARVKTGTNDTQLGEDIKAIGRAAGEAAPRENEGRVFVGVRLLDRVVGDYRQRLFILLGAVSLVFLISCVNVASLLMARGAGRSREISVRAALGASRPRIARQLMTEALVLCALGAGAGLLLAAIAVPVFVAQGPADVPRLAEARISTPVLMAAALVALLATLLAGLVPALRESRAGLSSGAAQAWRGSTRGAHERVRQAFVVAEVALTLMLLMGAGLLIRSDSNLRRVSPGFDPDNLLSARVALPEKIYAGEEKPAAAIARIVSILSASPGVAEAAASTRPPMIGDVGYGLRVEGRDPSPQNRLGGRMQLVTPGYLDTMRVPLRMGRAFTADDRRNGARVMIVGETLARVAWPGESPLGKRVACCEGSDSDPAWKEVVGVVADTRARGLASPGLNEFYLPMDQAPSRAFEANGGSISIVARAKNGSPLSLTPQFREAVRTENASLPLYDLATMASRVQASTAVTRFNRLLMIVLGFVGLALSAIGIYGVIAYVVSQRAREFSVRMAMGARPKDVVGLVMSQGLRAVGAGLILGGLGVAAQGRVVEALVFGVSGRDPWILGAAALVLFAVAALAGAVPAWRASRVDPARTLAEP